MLHVQLNRRKIAFLIYRTAITLIGGYRLFIE